MTHWADIKFTAADIIKGLAALGFLISMWVDLKTDQIKHQEEHALINYRINRIENCCNLSAIKPDEITFEK